MSPAEPGGGDCAQETSPQVTSSLGVPGVKNKMYVPCAHRIIVHAGEGVGGVLGTGNGTWAPRVQGKGAVEALHLARPLGVLASRMQLLGGSGGIWYLSTN